MLGWTRVTCLSMLALVWAAGCGIPTASNATSEPRTPAATSTPEPLILTVATGPASAGFAPVWLAVEHGYFARHGLHVNLQTGISGVNQAQAVLAGDIQVGNFGPSELLNARANGAEIIGIAESIFSPLFELHVAPEHSTVESLRGKAIAITRSGSSVDLAARIILSKHGLRPDQDVTLVQAGDQIQALAALQSGGVQGGVFSPPSNIKASNAGYPGITAVDKEGVVLIDLLTITSRAYADAHSDAVTAYLGGYLDGLHEFFTDPESTTSVIAAYTQSNQDTAREGYRAVRPTIDPRPFIREEGLKTIQIFDSSGRLGAVNLADAHDDQFLTRLQSAGMLDSNGAVAH